MTESDKTLAAGCTMRGHPAGRVRASERQSRGVAAIAQRRAISFRTLALLALLGLAPQLQGCVEMAMVGAGAVALAADDRRSLGAQTEDKEIELRGSSRISQRFGDRAHIDVTSYNRNVLLTGEAPDEATRTQAESIVREIPNVRGVVNAIQIAGVSSYTSRANDSYLTSKVKARFIDNGGNFSANQVKVVTESGVVYLLGLVTHKEADAAVEIARTTGGVQKVVRVFEYIEAPAK
ncbi:MAG: BON domain-containing protein [Burkholderiales bacterium]